MVKTIEEYEKTGTEAEKALIAACRAGRDCVLNGGKLPQEGAKDAPKVRADLIRLLAVEATSLHEKGVWLEGGVITGQLDLSFAKCRGRLVLDNCRFAKKPLMAQAKLAQLSMEGSHLPGLFAQRAQVSGSLVLRGVTATGTIDVIGAQIGGQLSCTCATLNGDGSYALNAQGARVTAGVFLRDLTATGTLEMSGAQIGGQLSCAGAMLNGNGSEILSAQSMKVDAGFVFRDIKAAAGRLDLSSAQVGDLVDDVSSWEKCSDVTLDGFTYDRISGNTAHKTFADRRDWLEKGSWFLGEFRPQPYTQFAKVVRAAGHQAEARKALMARDTVLFQEAEKADRKAYLAARDGGADVKGDAGWIWMRLHARRLVASVSRRVIGHGHQPQYALFWALAAWGIGALCYGIAYKAGLMVPNSDVILTSAEWLQAVAAEPEAPTALWMAGTALASKHYETFFALIYALDMFLPIVDLGQESAWAVTTTTNAGWVLRGLTFLYQLSGWLITSLGLAAITGFVQRNAPD